MTSDAQIIKMNLITGPKKKRKVCAGSLQIRLVPMTLRMRAALPPRVPPLHPAQSPSARFSSSSSFPAQLHLGSLHWSSALSGTLPTGSSGTAPPCSCVSVSREEGPDLPKPRLCFSRSTDSPLDTQCVCFCRSPRASDRI